MKIESLIKRKNGTRITLDAPNRLYHFKPTETEPRHLAEVTEASHIAMLLRIRDGFRAVDGEELPEDTTDASKAFERELKGSAVHNATYTIKGGDTIELADLVNMAFEDSGLSEDDWNALDDQERYEFIDTTLGELVDPPQSDLSEETPPAPAPVADAPTDDGKAPQPEKADAGSSEGAEDETAKELPESRDEWVAKYKALYGRNPNKSLTDAQIKRAVVDA